MSRRHSIADWTALKSASMLFATGMVPVGSSMESSLAVTFSMIVLVIQSLAMPISESQSAPSWSGTYCQIAARPRSWTSLMKFQTPVRRSTAPRSMSTRSGPRWRASFCQRASTVTPRTLRTRVEDRLQRQIGRGLDAELDVLDRAHQVRDDAFEEIRREVHQPQDQLDHDLD